MGLLAPQMQFSSPSSMASYEAASAIINRDLPEKLPSHMRGYFPTKSSVKRNVQHFRNKIFPTLPNSLNDIEISGEWLMTNEGENWILCDNKASYARGK